MSDRDDRLRALDEVLADYELEFGAFDDGELERTERRAKAGAIVPPLTPPGGVSGRSSA